MFGRETFMLQTFHVVEHVTTPVPWGCFNKNSFKMHHTKIQGIAKFLLSLGKYTYLLYHFKKIITNLSILVETPEKVMFYILYIYLFRYRNGIHFNTLVLVYTYIIPGNRGKTRDISVDLPTAYLLNQLL